MNTGVITRFAPSPTGFLHIGGARTALFNWLYARAKGGKMLLRIEDTDRARSTDSAIQAIMEGLNWLDLKWDDDAIFQHANATRHQEVAHQLVAQGLAYRCYSSPDELQAMRDEARAQGRPPIYDGTWRDRPDSDAPPGIEPAIRFKAPRNGETVIKDEVQGDVTFRNETLDDLILLRSNGTPTYMLSVVVDDHDMGVTHIIRGDDHLTNAARQAQIYLALNWTTPVFAHIPLIHGPDGAKLSKRHGALGVEAYREMGFLPEAMRNYLVRLGWSHGDDEIMSLDQMIEWFDLKGINKGAARFDFAKLESMNKHYIRNKQDELLLEDLESHLALYDGERFEKLEKTNELRGKLQRAMPQLKERAKTMIELNQQSDFLYNQRPITLNDKAKSTLDAEARQILGQIGPILQQLDPWSVEGLETTLKDFVNRQGLKLGKLAQPLRAALTGTLVSPGIYDVMAILGRDETLSRILDQAQ